MAKDKPVFVCESCGLEHSKWQGQCSACNEWNTLKEFKIPKSLKNSGGSKAGKSLLFGESSNQIAKLNTIDLIPMQRKTTGMQELDRVLGGGLVEGAAILLGGHPGAGKSTLLLQVACFLSAQQNVLYVSGEESLQQIAMRAERLKLKQHELNLMTETCVEDILATAQMQKPQVLIIDSIQTMFLQSVASSAGSVSQVRESASQLVRFAKETNTVLIMIGHVTKDGALAGPKVLEHIIDTSLVLEGDEDSRFRSLRSNKNRFGAVNELGVFAMLETGLREVSNPSAIFLSRNFEEIPGSLVTATWEGTRPLLVEVQALLDTSTLGNPRRIAVGLDTQRLALLLAILHKHGGIATADQDVFIKVVGGIKLLEPSADLAIILTILSSFKNRILPHTWLAFGEVGLGGEIRPVPSGQERIREAAKHGFNFAIVPKDNLPKQKIDGMEIKGITNLKEALEFV